MNLKDGYHNRLLKWHVFDLVVEILLEDKPSTQKISALPSAKIG